MPGDFNFNLSDDVDDNDNDDSDCPDAEPAPAPPSQPVPTNFLEMLAQMLGQHGVPGMVIAQITSELGDGDDGDDDDDADEEEEYEFTPTSAERRLMAVMDDLRLCTREVQSVFRGEKSTNDDPDEEFDGMERGEKIECLQWARGRLDFARMGIDAILADIDTPGSRPGNA